MSLKEATYYYVECDRAGCGARTGDMSEFSAWSDGGQAVDDWTNGDGYLDPDTGETFCGDHRPKLCAECDARATGVDADGDDACDEHRVTPSTPAPAASSPVPQAASGTVAEPAAAAPVAREGVPILSCGALAGRVHEAHEWRWRDTVIPPDITGETTPYRFCPGLAALDGAS